ncbi:MAG: hypothetical protein L6V93_20410 [Clostridiales bacterium]|nr:MAG: hypothetical protein L6V93_20410 [Clostridiales bacterium]
MLGNDEISAKNRGIWNISFRPKSFFSGQHAPNRKICIKKALEYANSTKKRHGFSTFLRMRNNFAFYGGKMRKKVIGVEIVDDAVKKMPKNAHHNKN